MQQQRKCENFTSKAWTDLDEGMKLDNYEDEDIFDVVAKLEKSFSLKFEKDAFYHVKTFGNLCDVFENHIRYDDRDDCTTQQAFYQVRNAIAATQHLYGAEINLDTRLVDVFPRHNRRQKVSQFIGFLEADINILTYPEWLALTFLAGILFSLVAFFFDWKIALAGIVFFISALKIADKLGKDFNVRTVRELAERLSTENYIEVRRNKGTVNRLEIRRIIIDTFSSSLDIDKMYLTNEAKFNWTK
jgi:hypothetical protein